jgi:hypothetical protein
VNNLQQQIAQAKRELQQNTRLRMGVWLILMIGLTYLALVQSDRLADAHSEFADQVQQLDRIKSVKSGSDWTDALAAEEARAENLATVLWKAESKGLAQASLQASIDNIISGLDLSNARIRSGVMQPAAEIPDVWQIQLQLDGRYRPGAELQLLYAIATHPEKLIIDRLDLSRQNSRLAVLVSAYFIGITTDERE